MIKLIFLLLFVYFFFHSFALLFIFFHFFTWPYIITEYATLATKAYEICYSNIALSSRPYFISI